MGSIWEYTPHPGATTLRIYVSGDTIIHDELTEIRRRYPEIDLAVLHLGGTDLIDQVRIGRLTPNVLIDVKKIAELNVVESGPSGLRLGAAVPCYQVYGHCGIVSDYSALAFRRDGHRPSAQLRASSNRFARRVRVVRLRGLAVLALAL